MKILYIHFINYIYTLLLIKNPHIATEPLKHETDGGGVATKHQEQVCFGVQVAGGKDSHRIPRTHPSGCAFGVWQVVEIATKHQEYTPIGMFLMIGSWKGDGGDW